ncbi:MAG: helix-turn-helix domain-containing protein [Candidatus Shapirobacteria bacterium]|jgi:excisionase family DNA binding protein
MNNNSQLLTPQEVAAELKLNLLTIYRYIKDKKILASKFGRKYRISKTDLSKFIKSNETY